MFMGPSLSMFHPWDFIDVTNIFIKQSLSFCCNLVNPLSIECIYYNYLWVASSINDFQGTHVRFWMTDRWPICATDSMCLKSKASLYHAYECASSVLTWRKNMEIFWGRMVTRRRRLRHLRRKSPGCQWLSLSPPSLPSPNEACWPTSSSRSRLHGRAHSAERSGGLSGILHQQRSTATRSNLEPFLILFFYFLFSPFKFLLLPQNKALQWVLLYAILSFEIKHVLQLQVFHGFSFVWKRSL